MEFKPLSQFIIYLLLSVIFIASVGYFGRKKLSGDSVSHAMTIGILGFIPIYLQLLAALYHIRHTDTEMLSIFDINLIAFRLLWEIGKMIGLGEGFVIYSYLSLLVISFASLIIGSNLGRSLQKK